MNKKNKVLLIVTITGIFGIMLLFNHLSPFFYDDFRYAYSFATGERINSISQIFESLNAHYYTMNGRLFLHFFAHFFCMVDGWIFDIVNAVAFVLMIILAYYHGNGTLKNMDYKLILMLFFAVWLSAPAFSESFLWLTGSVNYLFSIIFFLIALIPYRLFFKENEKRTALQNAMLCVCGLLCGILGGYTNENISVTFIPLQLMFWIAYFVNGYEFRIWMPFEFVGNIIGTVALFSSPTYAKRSDIWSEGFSVLSLIKTAVGKLPIASIAIIVYIMLPIILFILGLSVYLMKNKGNSAERTRTLSIAFIYALAMLVFGFSTVLCDYFPTRAWSPAIILILIPTVTLMEKNKSELMKKSYITDLCAVSVSLCILIGSFISAYTDLRDTNADFQERERVITEAKINNRKEVALKQIKANTKYSEFSQEEGEISDGGWINDSMAKYYGLDKIVVDHKE